MTAARATQAIPMLGPIISGGLLLASTILPTALHLCLESWSDPQRRVVDTGFNQGGQERNYWGDGESTWEQFQETNLLNLQLENNSKSDPADITEVIKTATIEVRKAFMDRWLQNRPRPHAIRVDPEGCFSSQEFVDLIHSLGMHLEEIPAEASLPQPPRCNISKNLPCGQIF